MSGHVHSWQPISGWTGRYRCACGVVGHRSTEADLLLGRSDTIREYLCARRVKGAACGKPAVRVGRDKAKSRCQEHAT